MIRVIGVSIDRDLRTLSRYLWQQGIAHRIIEESGEQVIFVGQAEQAEPVRRLVEDYLAGRVRLDAVAVPGHASSSADRAIENTWLYRLIRVVVSAPVTAAVTLICLVVALVTELGAALQRMDFLFYPQLPADSLGSLLGAIDGPLVLLQTLTPMFLHFSVLHLVFNLLWLWYFGRQLEAVQSSWCFLLLVILTAFLGNTAQYYVGGAANFGGLSGVVFGLVGYAWVIHSLVPGKRLQVNQSLFVVFMVVLVLMELLASSWIATAAHVGGLVGGLLAGVAVYALHRVRSGANDRSR